MNQKQLIGKNISVVRRINQNTQRQFSDLIGYTVKQVGRMEKGEQMSLDGVLAVAQAFPWLKAQDLFYLTEKENHNVTDVNRLLHFCDLMRKWKPPKEKKYQSVN